MSFENIKKHVLDRVIEKLYPKSVTAGDATPHLQFEHVKMGFLANLGEKLELCDDITLAIARSDPHRYKCSTAEQDKLAQEFNLMLQAEQVKFLTEMANELNKPESGTMKDDSAFSLWVNDPAHESRAAKFSNCFYDDKYKYYPGLKIPTRGQEDLMDFYFGPEDVVEILNEMGKMNPETKASLLKSVGSPAAPIQTAVTHATESSIKDAVKTLANELQKGGNLSKVVRREDGTIACSVSIKKEGDSTLITIQDSEGWDTMGHAGVWCSFKHPADSLWIKGNGELDDVLKTIYLLAH